MRRNDFRDSVDYVYEHGTVILGCVPAWTMQSFGVLYYRGFVGSILKSENPELLHGSVLGISERVCYEGTSPARLEENFHKAVDVYLEQMQQWEEESSAFQKQMGVCRKFFSNPDNGLYADSYDHGVWKIQTEVMYSLLREGFSFEEICRILHYTEEQSVKLKPFALKFFAGQQNKTEDHPNEQKST